MDKTQEAAHTPGPWWITESGVRDRGGYICHTNPPPHYPGQDERFAKETAERAANKVLIAAAPDLLQALVAIRKIFDKDVTFIGGGPQSRVEVPFDSHDQSWNHWHEARDLIRAAIAKATGAAAPTTPSLALTAFIQDVEAAEGKEAA